MKKRLAAIFLALLILAASTISLAATEVPLTNKLKFSESKLTLVVGESRELSVTITPDGASREIIFTSSKEAVATVNSAGVIEAVSKGSATITVSATDGSKKKATIAVTVIPQIEAIKLNKASLTLKPKSSATLKATVTPKGASNAVTFESENTQIATVSAKGKVVAVGPGETAIVVRSLSNTDIWTTCPVYVPEANKGAEMAITSAGVVDGAILPEYGQKGSQKANGVPTLSLPITISNAPKGTVGFVVIMTDADAKGPSGNPWVHWLAVNVTDAKLAQNASIVSVNSMVQGKNDFGTVGYGGPTPPSGRHTYTISVYAINTKLDLKNGFTFTQLKEAYEQYIIGSATMSAKY